MIEQTYLQNLKMRVLTSIQIPRVEMSEHGKIDGPQMQIRVEISQLLSESIEMIFDCKLDFDIASKMSKLPRIDIHIGFGCCVRIFVKITCILR